MEIRKLSKRERLDLYRAHCNSCVNPNALVEDLEILRLHKEGIPAVEIGARLNVAPEPVLSKVEQLENGLMAISEAARSAQDRLPWRGQEADAERWCLADIR